MELASFWVVGNWLVLSFERSSHGIFNQSLLKFSKLQVDLLSERRWYRR